MRVWGLVLGLGIALGCTGKDDDDDEGDDTSEKGIAGISQDLLRTPSPTPAIVTAQSLESPSSDP